MKPSVSEWKLAVAQMGASQNLQQNLTAVAAMLAEAGRQEVQLAVLPECILSGYMYGSREEAASRAVRTDGPELGKLAKTCAQNHLYAVVGYLERDDRDGLFNSAVLISDDGHVIANYRKTHLPHLGVDRFVDPGRSEPTVSATALGNIGLAICYDLRFPESARSLALRGAEVIAQPSTWPSAASILAEHFPPVRACENRVFLAVANRPDTESGTQFIGRSQIVAPSGQRIVEAAGRAEGLFCALITPSDAREKRIVTRANEYEVSLFADRRPELYGAIADQHLSS